MSIIQSVRSKPDPVKLMNAPKSAPAPTKLKYQEGVELRDVTGQSLISQIRGRNNPTPPGMFQTFNAASRPAPASAAAPERIIRVANEEGFENQNLNIPSSGGFGGGGGSVSEYEDVEEIEVDEKAAKMKKIMLYVGIGVGVLVVVAVGYFMFKK